MQRREEEHPWRRAEGSLREKGALSRSPVVAVPRAAEKLRGKACEERRRGVGGEAREVQRAGTSAGGARGIPAEVAERARAGKKESRGGESKEEDEEARWALFIAGRKRRLPD